MSGEDPRRVADYFVVAGLSNDNPEPLDEHGLEANLKTTAYQDPITDITVIIPSLAENVPDYYQLVEMTPSGLSANLNHGSFRAPEVFLCYRRSRDRPPLLDIGILYEGKDKLLPDSQVIEGTPYGHCANVNNSQTSPTYLTYRRAMETSPCNEAVVMDICVIIASKGEQPPHSFKLIDKSLNKGMVGSDVYICYKKTINRPDLISYKPSLLHRFPLRDNPTYKLENTVALFCLPMGATLECWPAETTRPPALSSTFVLTLANREKVYGSAITFYEEFDEDLLAEDQRKALNLGKYSRKSDRNIFANRCICLLSRWPFFEAFEEFLFFLHKIQLMGPFDVPIEKYISHFLYDVPFPSPERPRILVELLPEEEIALFQPVELPLPRSGASFRNLLCNLGPDNCLLVLLLALTEQKLLFHSLRPSVLTSVAEAIIQIIFPFYWQCPYIPLCPIGMSDYLAAPLPFVVGFDSRFFDLYDQPTDVNCIDLDTNTVTLCEEKKNLSIKLLPKKPSRQLRAALVSLTEKCLIHNKLKHKMEAHNDGAIDFVFRMKQKEMFLEMEIREIFLHFMVAILQGYRNFLLPITTAPKVGATDVANLFDSQGFLRSRDRNYHKFYTMLMRTQMFTKFIEERSFVSETNDSLAFFDECMDRQSDHHGYEPVRFLELEGSVSDRTVFILPPDASDLPSGGVYRYKNFGDLKPELFKEREEEESAASGGGQPSSSAFEAGYQSFMHLARGGGNFSTPVAALAKRTKQEIRSAQKSARKCAEKPLSWSMCLVGATYSLWYIHLPGFMLANNGKPHTLRVGLALLHRMHKLRLIPADEICYRVMMQLCGVYDQPVLAVKLLFEMKSVRITPNAVTYGYYNKAVLESEWPSGALSHSQVLWNKIRNVIKAVHLFRVMGRLSASRPKTAQLMSATQLAVGVALSGSKQSLLSKDSESANSDNANQKEEIDTVCHNELHANDVTEVDGGQEEEEPSNDGDVTLKRETSQVEDGNRVTETDEDHFRKRLSSIVKPSPDPTAQEHTTGKTVSRTDSSTKESPAHTPKATARSPTRTLHQDPRASLNFAHKATDHIGDLKISNLGQDKDFFDKLKQEPKTNGTKATTQGVNRVLFRSEEEEDEVEEEWKRDRSSSQESEGGIKFESDHRVKNSPLGKPLLVIQDSPSDKINPLGLSPPSGVHRVGSSSSFKLTGIPVTENDPLGALSLTDSPATNQTKSATMLTVTTPPKDADEILGTPFAEKSAMARSSTMPLDESRQHSTPTTGFASPSLAMSLSSLKSLTKSGQSRLNSLKKSGYFSGWSSPSSKKAQEALSQGVSTLKSAYSSATVTLSKKVEELREYQTPQKSMSPAVSNLYLTRDDDATSQGSNSSRRPSEVTGPLPTIDNTESWSYLTGQIWEQLWGYNLSNEGTTKVDSSAPSNAPSKTLSDLFEDVYTKMPRRPPGPVAMELEMTSCSRCHLCGCILYDEEIMSGWTAEDSNLNTKCTFCERWLVPLLTIRVIDFRTRPLSVMATLLTPAPSVDSLNVAGSTKDLLGSALSLQQKEFKEPTTETADSKAVPQLQTHNRSASDGNASIATSRSSDEEQVSGHASTFSLSSKGVVEMEEPIVSEPITVPYLSPLVLRKELENLLEKEGDGCLVDPDCADEHPIIFWNLVWYFERIAVKSHLPGLCLKAKSLNKENDDSTERKKRHDASWSTADHRNIFIRCKWDNELLHDDNDPPVYTQWHVKTETDMSSLANTAQIVELLNQQEQSSLRPLMEQIIFGVQQMDLLQPIKSLLDERSKSHELSNDSVSPKSRPPNSIYREILFLTLIAMSQDNIDLSAFDREYRRAFEKLPTRYDPLVLPHDKPPEVQVILCRKLFRELRI